METISSLILMKLGQTLGNFLSGMETQPRGLFRGVFAHLGNFLSGMETAFGSLRLPPAERLGNFLSGMETSYWKLHAPNGGKPWKLP